MTGAYHIVYITLRSERLTIELGFLIVLILDDDVTILSDSGALISTIC